MLAVLQKRAALLASIRQFFAERGVLEVEVPVIGASTVTDPHLEPLLVRDSELDLFLQTSPEFFLKRLLSQGIGCVYYMGKAFRQDEAGVRHNPEFTMLEWYRMGLDDKALMAEVGELLSLLCPEEPLFKKSYGDVFQAYIGVDPHGASAETLQNIAHKKLDINWQDADKNLWLDLLFSHLIEPQLTKGFTLVYDYPASQCALAKLSIDEKGREVAKRFELFGGGMELANGYWELTDAEEQRRRFEADNRERAATGKAQVKFDEAFLAALEQGIPECAGIALGVDRLLMCLVGAKHISEVLAFPKSCL